MNRMADSTVEYLICKAGGTEQKFRAVKSVPMVDNERVCFRGLSLGLNKAKRKPLTPRFRHTLLSQEQLRSDTRAAAAGDSFRLGRSEVLGGVLGGMAVGLKPMGSHSGVGEFTTHFRTYFSGDWDVHCGYVLAFDP